MNKNRQSSLNIACSELLRLPELSGCRLLTGGLTICREVQWVHYITPHMELDFLCGGEFLVGQDLPVQELERLLQPFRDRRCSALLLAFSSGIPDGPELQQFLDLALSLRIPVFGIGRPIEISDVCAAIGGLIFQKQHEEGLEAQVIRQLLIGDILDSESLRNKLKLVGYSDKEVCVSAMVRADGTPPPPEAVCALRKNLLDSGYSFVCCSIFDENLVFILPAQAKNGKSLTQNFTQAIEAYQQLEGAATLHCGIGLRWTKLTDMKYSSNVALKLARLRHRHSVRDIEHQYIFRLLCQFDNVQEIYNIYSRVFQPLIQYDKEHNTNLMQCLKAYLECNQNLCQSARVMYLHINTMRNRIVQIENLLGWDLRTEKWNLFRYYLGFFLEDYLYANTNLLENVSSAKMFSLTIPMHEKP